MHDLLFLVSYSWSSWTKAELFTELQVRARPFTLFKTLTLMGSQIKTQKYNAANQNLDYWSLLLSHVRNLIE